jgi:CRP-like cAMP-binding protein
MHAQVVPLSVPALREACSQCNLRELCLPMGLSQQELDQLDQLVNVRRRIHRGQHLYRGGDVFEAIYAIKTGFFKTDVLLEDGREQVTGRIRRTWAWTSVEKHTVTPWLSKIAGRHSVCRSGKLLA